MARPTIAIAGLLVGAALALPAGVSAGTVSSSGGEIRHTAGPGERNLLTILADGNDVVLTDIGPGADIAAGPGCTRQEPAASEPQVRCPAAGAGRITLDLGDGNDEVVDFFGGNAPQPAPLWVIGGPGSDDLANARGAVTLDGVANDGLSGQDNIGRDVENVFNAFDGTDERFTGSDAPNRFSSPGGTDVFAGEGGDDYLNTRDVRRDLEANGTVAPDQVSCGSGNDVADVDDPDTVAADCEIVIRNDNVATLTDAADTFRAQRPGLTIFALAGNDVIFAGGAPVVSGGAGNDRITLGSTGIVTADGNSGNDWIYGLVGRDRIIGGAGHDKLYGERSADRIDGGAGRDGINAGQGDDVVRVRDGEVDRVKCSSGRDVVVADRRDRVQRDCERVSRR